MNWYKLSTRLQMTWPQAMGVFGFPANSSPSADEIKKRYRQLAMKFHPDRSPDNIENFRDLEKAYTTLNSPEARSRPSDPYSGRDRYSPNSYDWRQRPSGPSGPSKGYQQPNPKTQPDWQTDSRSSNNNVGADFRDVNFVKKAIHDRAKESGGVQPMFFMAFDGTYFRGNFTAFANPSVLGYAGEMMELWNSKGANSYPTEAVVVSLGKKHEWGFDRVQVIRLKGQDVSGQNIILENDDEESRGVVNSKSIVFQLQQLLRYGVSDFDRH